MSVRYLSCGDTAFSVEFGNEISPEINGRVMALHAAIGQAKIAGVVETVPSMRALMVCYDPMATSRAKLEPEIEGLIARGLPTGMKTRQVTIPCCYDDPEFAPDLKEIAERTKKKVEDESSRSTWRRASRSTCWASCRAWPTSRGWRSRSTCRAARQPRVRVPRSTVAIAMDMTTIYPFESPGGWHLIGRTPLWMFDQRREQPVFLAPGDSLTFQRIDRKTYDRVAREVEAGTFDWAKLVRS